MSIGYEQGRVETDFAQTLILEGSLYSGGAARHHLVVGVDEGSQVRIPLTKANLKALAQMLLEAA